MLIFKQKKIFTSNNNNKNRRYMKREEKHAAGDKASTRSRIRYNTKVGTVRQATENNCY